MMNPTIAANGTMLTTMPETNISVDKPYGGVEEEVFGVLLTG